jgi:hypothetical protein
MGWLGEIFPFPSQPLLSAAILTSGATKRGLHVCHVLGHQGGDLCRRHGAGLDELATTNGHEGVDHLLANLGSLRRLRKDADEKGLLLVEVVDFRLWSRLSDICSHRLQFAVALQLSQMRLDDIRSNVTNILHAQPLGQIGVEYAVFIVDGVEGHSSMYQSEFCLSDNNNDMLLGHLLPCDATNSGLPGQYALDEEFRVHFVLMINFEQQGLNVA